MNCLLIGYGEIGKGLEDYYSKYHVIDIIDLNYKKVHEAMPYDIMMVAIPYNKSFVEIVKRYSDIYKPDAIVIFSSVAIGTTSQIEKAVHVPIEGNHPNLAESIARWPVFMGGGNAIAKRFFDCAFKEVYVLDKPENTEFLKLQSTTHYGANIEYARYVGNVCEALDMSYNEVMLYNMQYNELYIQLGFDKYKRYLLTPPEGPKGGHCVTPNAKLLQEAFPSVMVDIVAKDGE